jgi:hypothetical protein
VNLPALANDEQILRPPRRRFDLRHTVQVDHFGELQGRRIARRIVTAEAGPHVAAASTGTVAPCCGAAVPARGRGGTGPAAAHTRRAAAAGGRRGGASSGVVGRFVAATDCHNEAKRCDKEEDVGIAHEKYFLSLEARAPDKSKNGC